MDKLSPLASPTATRAVLEAHGLTTKYSLGQNFLINDAILQKIVALAEAGPTDRVLEVGPGIGTLTVALLKHVSQVTSVERDPDLPAVLAETLTPWADRFTLVEKDALDLTTADLPYEPTKLVANLPYAVAATVVLDYFEHFPSITSATVMVQKAVSYTHLGRLHGWPRTAPPWSHRGNGRPPTSFSPGDTRLARGRPRQCRRTRS